MDVAAYIKELLNRERMVYVPGLGTFLTRRTPGVYHQQQQRFYPPKNEVDFVEEEKNDDTLENYISDHKHISPQAARYFIEKFVDQLKTSERTKNLPVKEALFSALQTEAPETNGNAAFNQENFGLPPVNLVSLIAAPAAEPAENAVPERDYVESFYREFSQTIPDEPVKTKQNTGFWGALVLLLAVCLLGIYALYLYYPDIFGHLLPKRQNTVAVIQPDTSNSLKNLPPVTSENQQDSAQTIPAANDTPASATSVPAIKTETVPVAKKPATAPEDTLAADPDMVSKSPYEVIGAAFKTLKGAKTFLSQLKTKGMMHAKILKGTAGKATLVTFGSFQDKESATAALERLRARDNHSEAYIQHYNK